MFPVESEYTVEDIKTLAQQNALKDVFNSKSRIMLIDYCPSARKIYITRDYGLTDFTNSNVFTREYTLTNKRLELLESLTTVFKHASMVQHDLKAIFNIYQ